MANEIEKLNAVAIADIEKFNGKTDDNIEKINGFEFTGVLPESHTLIATATSDGSDSSLGFVDGTGGVVFDSTYDVYEFIFTNIHAQTDTDRLGVQFNASGGSGFNETMQTTFFDANASEGGGGWLSYDALYDQVNGTGYQPLAENPGNDNDQSTSGMLTLYDPSDTTYIKHFIVRLHRSQKDEYHMDTHVAGYINTTSAIDEIDFKFDSGEIQGGEIKMYGLAKS